MTFQDKCLIVTWPMSETDAAWLGKGKVYSEGTRDRSETGILNSSLPALPVLKKHWTPKSHQHKKKKISNNLTQDTHFCFLLVLADKYPSCCCLFKTLFYTYYTTVKKDFSCSGKFIHTFPNTQWEGQITFCFVKQLWKKTNTNPPRCVFISRNIKNYYIFLYFHFF